LAAVNFGRCVGGSSDVGGVLGVNKTRRVARQTQKGMYLWHWKISH